MEFISNDYKKQVVVEKVFAYKYYPKILKNDNKNRVRSSFLYILKGKYQYKFNDTSFFASDGETVYLPKGATYSYEILSDETEVMQVEFALEEIEKSSESDVIASKNPLLIKGNSNEIKLLFEELLNNFSNDKLKTISVLLNLICLCRDSIQTQQFNKDYAKIIPAIQYIESHITEKIYLEEVALVANVSQSHLRRLFSKCLGMSPISYKNSVLIKIACNMLLHEGLNVSETADALRFADVYTFSQFFKKEKGVSPKKYIESKKKD